MKLMHTWFILYALAASVASLRLNSKKGERSSNLLEPNSDVPVLAANEAPKFFKSMSQQMSSRRNTNVSQSCFSGNLLIVVYGLMRSYKHTWPILRKQLKLGEISKCGGRVDVVVNTDLMTRCNEKDIEKNRCNEDWLKPSDAEYLQQIKETYSPYLKAVFDSSKATTNARIKDTLERVQSFQAIGEAQSLNQYTHLLAIRADGMLSPDRPATGYRGKYKHKAFQPPIDFDKAQIDVEDICKKSPGFNIIHGNYPTNCWIHNRDADKGFLACDPELIKAYLAPGEKESCKTTSLEKLPELPKDFGGAWDNTDKVFKGEELCRPEEKDYSYNCNLITEFKNRNARLGTLDDHGIFVNVNFNVNKQ